MGTGEGGDRAGSRSALLGFCRVRLPPVLVMGNDFLGFSENISSACVSLCFEQVARSFVSRLPSPPPDGWNERGRRVFPGDACDGGSVDSFRQCRGLPILVGLPAMQNLVYQLQNAVRYGHRCDVLLPLDLVVIRQYFSFRKQPFTSEADHAFAESATLAMRILGPFRLRGIWPR